MRLSLGLSRRVRLRLRGVSHGVRLRLRGVSHGMRLGLGGVSHRMRLRRHSRLMVFSRLRILTRKMGLFFCIDLLVGRGLCTAFCRNSFFRSSPILPGQRLRFCVPLRYSGVGLWSCCGQSRRSSTIDCR
jgi:hypothetical protein